MARIGRPLAELTLSEGRTRDAGALVTPIDSAQNLAQRCRIVLGGAATSWRQPVGARWEHGERDFPKLTAPPLDPGNRKEEW
jgi:hypothetical protein